MMKSIFSGIQWRELVAWLPVLGLLMVLSALPFGWSDYQRIGIYVLGIGYVADYSCNQRWKQFSWSRGKWIYVVMLMIVAMFFIREWFDPTALTDYAYSQFHLHDWFLYIGIAGLLGFSDKLQLRHVTYVMLATSVVMMLVALGYYFFTDEWSTMPPFYRFNKLRALHVNSHMVVNLYINTAIILCFSILRSESRWRRGVLIAVMLFLWGMIMISDGRIGQATSLLIMLGCTIHALPRKHWYIGFIVSALFAVSAAWFISHNPRASLEKATNDPRFAVYDYSWRMIEQKPIEGYGLSTLSVQFVEGAYQDSVMYNGFVVRIMEMDVFAQLGKTMRTHHAHNAFLHYWLAFGIAGPLLLLALFGTAASLPVDKHYRFYLWLFLLAIFIQCITEPVGQHIKPQFISILLLIWQCAALPNKSLKSE